MGLFDVSLGSLGILAGRTWGPDGPMRASRHTDVMDEADPFDIDTDELDDEIATTK